MSLPICQDIDYWKRRCEELDLQDPVVRWTIANAGGVFMGSKSGELLTLNVPDFADDAGAALGSIEKLADRWGFALEILQTSDTRVKLVIYEAARVNADLAAVPEWALAALEYAPGIDAPGFFREIRSRWTRDGCLPHEIGFGLGYPAKDVLGYLGLVDLAPTGECGWRVYGDPAPSYERGRDFAQARAVALACVA